MHIEKTLRVVGIVTAALALATMIGGGLVTSSHAQGEQKFTAKMTGKEEVPSKDTKATGDAEFILSGDGE